MIAVKITELTRVAEKNPFLPLRNFPDSKYENILEKGKPLRYFINQIGSGAGLKYNENGEIPYIVGEDIDDFGFVHPTKYVEEAPLILKRGTLLTGRVGSVGKVTVLDIDATCSDSILYLILKDKHFTLYLKWFFLSKFGKYQLNKITKGKSQPVINKTNLLRFRVVVPTNLSVITKRLLDIEKKIIELRKTIRDTSDIVNEVFSRYFKLDLKQYSDLEEKHIFRENLPNLSKSAQLRSSLKFHHPKYDFILEKVKEFKTVKLKQLLKEPVRRGVQPEYDENGEILVIKTININKNGYIDLTETDFVSDEFYNKVKKRAGIQRGNILITSTGEGRGKVSLYNLDEPAIADTHVSIVRCKDVNTKYLTYFLLSSMGKNQLSVLEQAIKGTPEIYPREIEKLIVIYPSPEIQNDIVKEIEAKLSEQRKITVQIEKLKQEIDNMIEKAILGEETKND